MRWIASCENVPYHAWQALLLAHTTRSKCGMEVDFIVHDNVDGSDTDPLWPSVPNVTKAEAYRSRVLGQDYPPRNTPGTLLVASRTWPNEDWFVLLDPDMLPATMWTPELKWSADKVGYGPAGARVGVPYVIAGKDAKRLALEWLAVLDSAKRWSWEMVMWAYVVAMRRLGIEYAETEWAQSNYVPGQLLTKPLVHYCYGDWKWNKRAFIDNSAAPFMEIPRGNPGSVESAIFSGLRATKAAILGGEL